MEHTFAKRTFLIAGIYGILVLFPMFFTIESFGNDFPPAITHPEFYYGFVACALAWQVVFIIISRDPVRYRPLMLPAALLEKFIFVGIVAYLYLTEGMNPNILAGASIDFILGILFIVSFIKTKEK